MSTPQFCENANSTACTAANRDGPAFKLRQQSIAMAMHVRCLIQRMDTSITDFILKNTVIFKLWHLVCLVPKSAYYALNK